MRKILKKTALISGLTFSSRVMGLVRDAIIAMMFGISATSDTFFLAFRPFDLVRKLFSEGILSISFIPVFSSILEKKGRPAAITMLFSFFCFLSVAAVLAVLAGFFFAPQVIRVIAPGFLETSSQHYLAALLFKLMIPYFWFILITALSMGVLNSFGHFGAPAAAPVVFNLVVISFALFTTNYFQVPITALAIGVTTGGILQLALQIPFLVRLGVFKTTAFRFFTPETWRVLKIMVPSMIGAASYQINIMVASFFASRLDEGSVSFLYYADRLVQFPLALFAISVATVFLPDLSKKAAAGRVSAIGPIFSKGVTMVLFITIPAMAGLMALDKSIVTVLFGHGSFDAQAISQTAECLFVLVTGLWAFTGVRLFVTLYYALSNIRIPFYSGMIAICINFILCQILVGPYGLQGLVLSVSFSAATGFIFLLIHLPNSVKIDKMMIIVSACRSVFFSVIMYFLVKTAAGFMVEKELNAGGYSAGLLGCICLGILFYFGVNHIISSQELKLLKQGMIKKQ